MWWLLVSVEIQKHAKLYEKKRVNYTAVTDAEALTAFTSLAKTESIIPALEFAHALGFYIKECQ